MSNYSAGPRKQAVLHDGVINYSECLMSRSTLYLVVIIVRIQQLVLSINRIEKCQIGATSAAGGLGVPGAGGGMGVEVLWGAIENF